MQGSKIWMGLIKKQDFGVTSEIVKAFLEGWDAEWRRKGLIRIRDISCLVVAVIIGLCGVFQGEEVFMIYLKGMLKL